MSQSPAIASASANNQVQFLAIFDNAITVSSVDPDARMPYVMRLKNAERELCAQQGLCPFAAPAMRSTPCTNGRAGEYECDKVDLLSFVPLSELGCGGNANDIWGWTDPETKQEYAMIGCYDGTSFVDVTNPEDPQVVGFLRTHTTGSSRRDLKACKFMICGN